MFMMCCMCNVIFYVFSHDTAGVMFVYCECNVEFLFPYDATVMLCIVLPHILKYRLYVACAVPFNVAYSAPIYAAVNLFYTHNSSGKGNNQCETSYADE